MAATRIYITPLHEVWNDTVVQDGGVTQNLSTNIQFFSSESDEVIDTVLTLNTQTGTPVFVVTYSSVADKLVVSIANTAAAGNSSKWKIDIRYLHTFIR